MINNTFFEGNAIYSLTITKSIKNNDISLMTIERQNEYSKSIILLNIFTNPCYVTNFGYIGFGHKKNLETLSGEISIDENSNLLAQVFDAKFITHTNKTIKIPLILNNTKDSLLLIEQRLYIESLHDEQIHKTYKLETIEEKEKRLFREHTEKILQRKSF